MLKKITPFSVTVVFAIAFVLAHFIAAALLAKERLFLDSTYYFFHVLNESGFRIESQRVILILSQCLLVAGVNLHLSTPCLLVIYSVTPVIYSAVLIFISLYYFKSEAGAWAIMLCSVCGTWFLYYCPMYEACYVATTFAFLWLLTERGFYKTPGQLLLYILIVLTALWGHPTFAFACLVLPLYYVTNNNSGAKRLLWVYGWALVTWVLIKHFFISDYEAGKINIPLSDYGGIIKSMLSLSFVLDALKFLFQHYKEAILCTLMFVVLALRNKKYLSLILQIASVAGYVFIVNFGAHGNGLVYSNYYERIYLLLVPLCLAPFIYTYFSNFGPPVKLLCILVLMVVVSYKTAGIWAHSSYYTYRQQVLNKFALTYTSDTCSKVAVPWEKLPPELDQWSTGMEILLYTSMHGKGHIISDATEVEKLKTKHPSDNRHFIIRLNEVMDVSELNPRYFNLDTSVYCFVLQ